MGLPRRLLVKAYEISGTQEETHRPGSELKTGSIAAGCGVGEGFATETTGI